MSGGRGESVTRPVVGWREGLRTSVPSDGEIGVAGADHQPAVDEAELRHPTLQEVRAGSLEALRADDLAE